jgi:uncharacterized membrane protein
MLLMAIDHVRVYSGLPAGGPTSGIFLTRWITHFVAPSFIFLAGTAAFLHGRTLAGRSALARFLLSRGLWLVFLELTILRVAWTFNFDFSHYFLAGVIWVIGWCMVLLAGLIFLPLPALAAFGLAIVLGHNTLDHYSQTLVPAIQNSHWSWLWQVLYFGGPIQLGEHGPTLFVLYSIVPWVGVMALGYVFGRVMIIGIQPRRKLCLALGAASIFFFLILRGLISMVTRVRGPHLFKRQVCKASLLLAFLPQRLRRPGAHKRPHGSHSSTPPSTQLLYSFCS